MRVSRMLRSATSAFTRVFDALLAAIEDRLAATRATLDLSIDASDGAGISWLHRHAEVLNKELHDGRFDMTVRVDETKHDIVVNRFDAVPHAVS